MAEVHVIGQIVGASGFTDQSLFAKWNLNTGSCWKALEGFTEGQTHLSIKSTLTSKTKTTDTSESTESIECPWHPWSHPIDVHYLAKGLQGWPRLELQVYGVDWLGKCNISAYGYLNLPSRPGYHELACYTWRPVGDFRRRLIDSITGYRMHLVDPSDIISNGSNRNVLQSESMGTVRVNVTMVLKDFQEYGVDI